MKQYPFPKKQRLTNSIRVTEIYTKGQAFITYPFRVVYVVTEMTEKVSDVPLKVLISVPKRRFKHAVDRNMLRRRTRESLRLQQQKLIDTLGQKGKAMDVTFNYVSNDLLESSYISKSMKKALDLLIKSLE